MTSVTDDRQALRACLAAGEFARAVALGARMVQRAPEDPGLAELHATALLGAGRANEAIDLLLRLAAAGAPASVHARLATAWAGQGDFGRACASAEAGLELDPGDFRQRLLLAECLEAQGRVPDALAQYFRAVTTAQRAGRWLNDATTAPALRERVRRAMQVIDRGREALFSGVIRPLVEAHGAQAMRRVSDALRIYLGLSPRPAEHPHQKPTFFWVPGLVPSAYFAPERFPWYEVLEDAAPRIRDEARDVLARREGEALEPFLGAMDPAAGDAYLGGDPATRAWDAYFFYRHGQRFDAHHARCPTTSRALEQVPLTRIADHAPEVLFSVLSPGTHIKPHYGVTNTRLVTHLPLIVPQGDCALVVGDETHRWREGRCVTFDDTFLHEAWNRAGQVRVVLILDCWHPDLREEERVALRALVEAIGDFNRRAGLHD